jgi:hypothetical protein
MFLPAAGLAPLTKRLPPTFTEAMGAAILSRVATPKNRVQYSVCNWVWNRDPISRSA